MYYLCMFCFFNIFINVYFLGNVRFYKNKTVRPLAMRGKASAIFTHP